MGAINFSIDEQLLVEITRLTPAHLFVETGTFQGDTLAIARRYFNECWSVDLSAHYFEAAKKQFAGSDRIHLFNGPSPAFLLHHWERFAAEPVLFWLDAHWCAAENISDEVSQSPLLDELGAIKSLHPQSVLLIDDARLYLTAPPAPQQYTHWPDFHTVLESLFSLSAAHRVMVLNDVIVFYPAQFHEPLSQYAHAHGVDWLTLANDARAHQRRRKKKIREQVLNVRKSLSAPFEMLCREVKKRFQL